MININVREYRTANLKNDNPEKLATLDEEKQNQGRYAPSYKPSTANKNRTSFLFGNHKGHHNTELRT